MLVDAIDLAATFVLAISAMQGMITCIGGDVVHDLPTQQIPTVPGRNSMPWPAPARLPRAKVGLPSLSVAYFGAGLCLFLRIMSIYRGWPQPVAPSKELHDETEK